MFTNGNGGSARQTAWKAELEIREAAREAVRNSSLPTMEDLVRSISPAYTPSSGRASVEPMTVSSAATRAELHMTQSLERIEQLEEQFRTGAKYRLCNGAAAVGQPLQEG
ncbi:unnamed protein product [Cylicocyclus nassatus]|uniref:Uncharacterized protein n=1 Tax=Cylicocyclus nassatus TaxID=53992 RepID=A0AA36GJL4_CYLNA|nr:unnamed protein product [Cylicocyclus nassatus]